MTTRSAAKVKYTFRTITADGHRKAKLNEEQEEIAENETNR